MSVGIGVDCTSVSRLAASIQRPHFVQRVFGQAEQALLQSRGGRAAETAAANVAAKEAFRKAVGTGLGDGRPGAAGPSLPHPRGGPGHGVLRAGKAINPFCP